MHDNVTKSGDVICYSYRDNDCLPKGKGNMPTHDTFGVEKFYDIPIKELRGMMSSKGLDTNSSINNLQKRCKNHAPVTPTKKNI